MFLDKIIYKSTRFHEKSILDVKTQVILEKPKPSSTHFTPLVTNQVLKKDLSKEKPLESYEQTPQKLRLRITINKKDKVSKNDLLTEVTHKL